MCLSGVSKAAMNIVCGYFADETDVIIIFRFYYISEIEVVRIRRGIVGIADNLVRIVSDVVRIVVIGIRIYFIGVIELYLINVADIVFII